MQNIIVEISADSAAKLWEGLANKRLFNLAHDTMSVEKLGTIVTIGA